LLSTKIDPASVPIFSGTALAINAEHNNLVDAWFENPKKAPPEAEGLL
jgi:hypothetical protein